MLLSYFHITYYLIRYKRYMYVDGLIFLKVKTNFFVVLCYEYMNIYRLYILMYII